jgi:hypothetical protein
VHGVIGWPENPAQLSAVVQQKRLGCFAHAAASHAAITATATPMKRMVLMGHSL